MTARPPRLRRGLHLAVEAERARQAVVLVLVLVVMAALVLLLLLLSMPLSLLSFVVVWKQKGQNRRWQFVSEAAKGVPAAGILFLSRLVPNTAINTTKLNCLGAL